MMKLERLSAFVAVADSGSISAAAQRLGLSKSVVSERLAELERDLGTSLIQRTTRKMSLTEDGSAFLQRARRIIRDIDEAVAELAERRGSLIGPLRLSAPVSFGSLHLGRHSIRSCAIIPACSSPSSWTTGSWMSPRKAMTR